MDHTYRLLLLCVSSVGDRAVVGQVPDISDPDLPGGAEKLSYRRLFFGSSSLSGVSNLSSLQRQAMAGYA